MLSLPSVHGSSRAIGLTQQRLWPQQGASHGCPRRSQACCASSSCAPAPDTPPAAACLLSAGVAPTTVFKVLQHCPVVVEDAALEARIKRNVGLLEAAGLTMSDITSILERTPAVASLETDAKLRPVLRFLLEDLGLNAADASAVVRRFPAVLTYGVQGHLRPQLAYLTSLGIQRSDLPAMVLARPYILGSGIEHLVNYLLRCGFPRCKVGRLIRSYPFEYRIPAINANSVLLGGDL